MAYFGCAQRMHSTATIPAERYNNGLWIVCHTKVAKYAINDTFIIDKMTFGICIVCIRHRLSSSSALSSPAPVSPVHFIAFLPPPPPRHDDRFVKPTVKP